MVDSGAALTFASGSFVEGRSGFRVVPLDPSDSYEASVFEGSRYKLLGKVRIYIATCGHTFSHMALVAQHMIDAVIMGSDLLTKYHLLVDYGSKSLRALQGRPIPFHPEHVPEGIGQRVIRLSRCQAVQAQAQQFVPVDVYAPEGADILFQPVRTATT